MEKTLFTIGYGNRTPAVLVGMLRDADVDVIDIRNYGTKAWCQAYWGKNICETLKPMRCHRLGVFGNACSTLNAYHGRLAQDAFVNDQLLLFAKLIGNGFYKHPCLLCAEIDPARCHRSILAEELIKRLGADWFVKHL